MLVLLLACADTPPLIADAPEGDADVDSDADADGDVDADSDADTDTVPPTFSGGVYPAYLQSCDDCHEAWGGDDDVLVYGYVTTATSHEIPLVVPGEPTSSLLYSKVADDTPLHGLPMPLEVRALSGDEVATFEAWIRDGALDDDAFRDVADIFERHQCDDCHRDWVEAGLRASFLSETVGDWRVVVPGSPEESLLVMKVDGSAPPVGDPMPLQEESLSEAQVAAIGAWIAAGAQAD